MEYDILLYTYTVYILKFDLARPSVSTHTFEHLSDGNVFTRQRISEVPLI